SSRHRKNMDAKGLIENLKADLTCPICLAYFTNPVTVKCGHSFCIKCLLRCREGAGADAMFTCPECRGVIKDSKLVINRSLQDLSIVGKILRPHLLQSVDDLTTCEQHGEKEKFFCEEDQRPLCESCSLASEHKDHQILPLNVAAEKRKDELQETWSISQEKEKAFTIALNKVRRNEEYCKEDADALKQSVRSEYKKMYQFLQNEENRHIQLLDQEYRDNLAKLEENKVKLSQQIQNLQRMTLQVEEDLDKAPSEMLRERKSLLERREELLLQTLEITSPCWSTCPITGLREVLRSFQRNITLDPESAHPHLILSKDLKRIEYRSAPKDLPHNKKSLDDASSILGAQIFTSGRHYWEVELGDNTDWEVGICEDSVSRKRNPSTVSGDVTALVGFKSGNDFFIWKPNAGYYVNQPIDKLGIFLDYQKGHVAFYNVTEESLLYSPPDTNFQGPLRPFFSLFIHNEEGTTASLTICPMSD
uniref:Tripartite motif containing 62 n=1 Tax=Vombatus ursinus TaxID=29139 RepID=A0A4X2K4W9_VOMUR